MHNGTYFFMWKLIFINLFFSLLFVFKSYNDLRVDKNSTRGEMSNFVKNLG